MITFSSGIDSVSINPPGLGYMSKISLATSPQKICSGWDVWDNGIAYDYRSVTLDNFVLDEEDASDLEDFIKGHRVDTLSLNLGSDSGFFPFGPDKGDSGIFTVKIVARKIGGFDQFNQFKKSITLLMVTAPEYVLPSEIDDGDFEIGSVDGLLYPQAGIEPSRTYGIATGVSYGGDAYSIDTRDDIHETVFTQRCNESKAAALLNFLSGSLGRYQDITLTAPAGFYLFDVANGTSGVYTCKLIQNEIECRHIENEYFEIPLSFWMKSAA